MKTKVKSYLIILVLFAASTITIAQDPELTSITPNAAKQGQSLTVIITGFDTNFSQSTPAQGTPTQGTPTQGTPTVADVWLSRDGSIIDWIDGWMLYDTLFFALFDIPEDANAGQWDVNVEVSQGTPTVVLTINDGFTVAQPGDITCDGAVNFFDVAVLSDHWLEGAEE